MLYNYVMPSSYDGMNPVYLLTLSELETLIKKISKKYHYCEDNSVWIEFNIKNPDSCKEYNFREIGQIINNEIESFAPRAVPEPYRTFTKGIWTHKGRVKKDENRRNT